MTEECASLDGKRQEIQVQFVSNKYKWFGDLVADAVGKSIVRVTRKPNLPPFWFNWLVVMLLGLLLGFLTSLLFNEIHFTRIEMIPREIAGAIILLVSVITLDRYLHTIFFSVLSNQILDAIESVVDLDNLQQWLKTVFNVRKQIIAGTVFFVILNTWNTYSLVQRKEHFIGIGPIITFGVMYFLAGVCAYFGYYLLALPHRLRNYKFKLYVADPSNSEIITHLSDLITRTVYIGAIFAGIITFNTILFGTNTGVIITILVSWIPITLIFIIDHSALSKIITSAKQGVLQDIQEKVESLYFKDAVPQKETLEYLDEFMSYYDRVKSTQNSALDIRAGLNYINSLLLPLIVFVISNVEKLLNSLE